MTAPLDRHLARAQVAYFSMEIAIRPEMHTYSGGLGGLAGDTARSCADLELPMVFVTLVSRAGYFRQELDAQGRQLEFSDDWDPAAFCTPLDAQVAVRIEGRAVWIRPWLYLQTTERGHEVPIILLDTDLATNDPQDREITHRLYGGDERYRLTQEIVLGLGGIRMLRALGFDVRKYHLNEGHAALLVLDLLNRHKVPESERLAGEIPYDIARVHEACVFTTHTPVAAGHDRFDYELVDRLLPDVLDRATMRQLGGDDHLNMTMLALNCAGYINGVARRHADTTRHMFPGYRVHTVTNGVHPGYWTHDRFARLFDAQLPYWRHEPEMLARATHFAEDEVWACHVAAKADLLETVHRLIGQSLDPDLPILGFARRMTGYKRPTLLFADIDRLAAIAERQPFQVVMAGKAHPGDAEGKRTIEQLHVLARRLDGRVTCVFLPDYDMRLARTLVAGADVWLNTPLPPYEASGTSGMKAALNGVLNLSVLDGWWIEACIDGVNGWAIGHDGDTAPDGQHAAALYVALEENVLPLWHNDPGRWRWMMKQSLATIGSYFNTHRMMRRYVAEAYFR